MPCYPLRFQDANFEYQLAACWSPLEGSSLKWIPFGMPRLDPNFQNAVFFLYERGPDGAIRGPLGTGVLIGRSLAFMPSSVPAGNIYAVTCAHVAPSGASIIRVNTTDGKSRLIEFEPHEWQFIAGAGDVAAIDVTESLSNDDDFSYVQYGDFVTEDFISRFEMGIGEDGFMLGLFADQPGLSRNMVAGRFGNLALLADESMPVEQPNRSTRPAHIFDLRSRPGFSGSPVFVYRTPTSDLRNMDRQIEDKFPRPEFENYLNRTPADIRERQKAWAAESKARREELTTRSNMFVRLLGIHAGQYPEKIQARKLTPIPSAESDGIIRDRDHLQVPSSMTVVIPSWEIAKLLDLPVFVQKRTERDMREKKRRFEKNVPLAETTEVVEAESDDANPDHLEDFMALRDAAAKGQSPKGRT